MREPAASGWVHDRLSEFADRTCLVTAERTIQYRELIRTVEAYADRFQGAGLTAGTTVFLLATYSFEGIAALLALHRIAAMVVPAADLAPEELERRKRVVPFQWEIHAGGDELECRSTGTTDSDGTPALIASLRAAGRPGLILFSSGSTGNPKAMLHDFDRILESYRGRRPHTTRVLPILRFDHIGGLNTLFHGLFSGSTLILPPDLRPETVARWIESERVQVLPASPSFLNLLLMSRTRHGRDWSSLRLITYGTEAMPEALLRRLRQAFPHVRFAQAFGSSETGIARTVGKSSDSLLFRFHDPATEYRIVDGELWMRSRAQALGYLDGDESAFTSDGWFRTGDRVEETQDGFLRILGRTDRVINVGGQKVHPLEVESVLLEMPEIVSCRVRSDPHPLTGEIVSADIAPAGPVEPAEMRARVRRHCRDRLAAFKVPAKVHITTVDALRSHTASPHLNPTGIP